MKLKSRTLIITGCLLGAIVGNNIVRFISRPVQADYFSEITAYNLTIILACSLVGGFLGHILRHRDDD